MSIRVAQPVDQSIDDRLQVDPAKRVMSDR
jgi:hypothetical protein